MKVKLIADYRGVLTNEEFYTAGIYATPADMPTAHAKALVAHQRAEEIKTVRRVSRKKSVTKGRRVKK